VIGFFLFLVVANARLSDRFRVEEFRNRLRALENADEEWADVLPERAREAVDGNRGSDAGDSAAGTIGSDGGSSGDDEPEPEHRPDTG